MVTVADRAGPVFAATVNATVPFPLPLAPEVIVIQVSDFTLVQLQPAFAVTVTDVALPPAAPTVCDAGLIAIEHDPACVIVNV